MERNWDLTDSLLELCIFDDESGREFVTNLLMKLDSNTHNQLMQWMADEYELNLEEEEEE